MFRKITLPLLIFTLFATPLLAQEDYYYEGPTQEDYAVQEDSDTMYKPEEFYEEEPYYEYPDDSFDEVIQPEDEFDDTFGLLFFGGFWVFLLCFGFVWLAGFIFNIVMLADCLQKDFEDRTLWIILLVIGLVFGVNFLFSLLYYFLVKRKLDK